MFPACLGITDNYWFDYLRRNAITDEVNFWIPSAPARIHVEPGSLWLLKLHAPREFIAGAGVFMHYSVLPLQLAWDAFGTHNGVATLEDLRAAIAHHHPRGAGAWDIPVGCAILDQVVYLPRDLWIPYRSGSLVSRKQMASAEDQGVVRQLLEHLATVPGMPGMRERPFYSTEYAPQYVLNEVRQGQATFRVEVLDAYHRQCAVSREHSLPVLEAAHIVGWSETHLNDVRNGILLRSDIHRLFDAGYVTVDPEGYRFVVSSRLKQDYNNGREYYQLQGTRILLPDDPGMWPDKGQLQCHNDGLKGF